jgi:outer membrane protein assembly factor BamE (lipoprotein component of BamABCDE complex)
MMKKVLLAVLSLSLLLFLSGCSKSVRYTEEEIKTFPNEIKENVRKGQIALGMTPEQVRYAWGAPDSIKFLEAFENKSREEWTYSFKETLNVITFKVLLFYDGKLIYIK